MSSNKKAQAPAPPPPKAPVPADPPKEKPDEGTETGGLSEFRKSDHVIEKVIGKIEKDIKAKIQELTKEDAPEKLEITGYRVNIVLGYMYFAKIPIRGKSFIQAKILETPQGEVSLQSVTETKTDEEEREYFKLPRSSK